MKHPIHILRNVSSAKLIGALIGLSALMASCSKDLNNPGLQYAPEMYESIPYDAFKQVRDSVTPFSNHLTMQIPPSGTVPRGGYLEGFEFGDGDSVKLSAGVVNYPNPIPLSDTILKQGEVLYVRFCAICHGKGGKGDGSITKNGAIKPKAYDSDALKNYTDGQIYHTIMYGKNNMMGYTSQLQYEERWKIVHYVKTLQGDKTAVSDTVATDTVAAVPAAPVEKKPKGKGK